MRIIFFHYNFAHFTRRFLYCYYLLTEDVTNTTNISPDDEFKGMETYSAAESKWLRVIVTIIC